MPELSLSEFAKQMNCLMPLIIKGFARRQANELYKGKITLPQFLILECLSREGESKMSALAHFMGVTTAAMTGIGERLVRDGYVVRGSDSQDRRIIRIKITSRGSELVKKINEQRREMIIKIFGRISAQDRKDYLRILMQIKDVLSKESPAEK